MRVRVYTVWCVSLLLCGVAGAEVRTFKTLEGDSRNTVQFVSKATVEEITGRTHNITGSLEVNLADLTAASSAKFSVDLTTLDTGISLRNQHMRDNHLETDQYPRAEFVLSKLTEVGKSGILPGETVKATAEGKFTVHGVSKTYLIPVSLKYVAASDITAARLGGNHGNMLVIEADWPVRLADHEISRPAFLFLKLAEEQLCSINIALSDAP